MIIRYSGLENCELPYYLISMCKLAGKKVLVYDNTQTNALFLSCVDISENTVTRGNVTITKNSIFKEEYVGDFDFTFILNGMYQATELPVRVDLDIINCNMERANMIALRKVLASYNTEYTKERDFIVSDIIAKKVSVKTIEYMVGVSTANEFTRPFDINEYTKYVNMTQSGGTDLRNLSDFTYEYLMSFACRYLGATEKGFKKFFVKKGGSAW